MPRVFEMHTLIAGMCLLACSAEAGQKQAESKAWTLQGDIFIDGADRTLSVSHNHSKRSACVAEAESIDEGLRGITGTAAYRFEWHCKNNTASGEADASGIRSRPSPATLKSAPDRQPDPRKDEPRAAAGKVGSSAEAVARELEKPL